MKQQEHILEVVDSCKSQASPDHWWDPSLPALAAAIPWRPGRSEVAVGTRPHLAHETRMMVRAAVKRALRESPGKALAQRLGKALAQRPESLLSSAAQHRPAAALAQGAVAPCGAQARRQRFFRVVSETPGSQSDVPQLQHHRS